MSRSARIVLIALLGATPACARRVALPPPALFPAPTAWTAAFAEPVEDAALSGDRLVVLTRGGTVRGLDVATGAIVWETPLGEGALTANNGRAVLRGPEGTVQLVQAADGRVEWRAESGVPGRPPALIDEQRVVVAGAGGAAALDVHTGSLQWTHALPPVRSASLQGGVLLLGEEDGTLRRRDPASGASLWAERPGGSSFTPAALGEDGRILLGGDGRAFLSLDPKDGSRDWRWRVGASVAEAPVLLGRRVLFATLEDVLYALDQGNGHMAWRADLPSRPLSGPLLLGPVVVVACHGARPLESVLVAVDGSTGRPLGTQVTPAELRPPILAGVGRLYLPLRNRRVMALRLGAS